MALTIRDTLLWYKRPEVRAAMIEGARKKEIGVRYDESFGKRPDALEYEQEILESVQRGATSFHASEELWLNPRSIETGMSKEKVQEIRTGWDLVLDVDFTNFPATKIITNAICQELEKHGVTHYGVKFSGNKGFHIGVAWESFPHELGTVDVAQQFPDAARQIADYIVWSLDNPDNKFALSEELRSVLTIEEVQHHAKKVCITCGRDRLEKKFQQHYACSRCGHTEIRPSEFDSYVVCVQCGSLMQKLVHTAEADVCVCGETKTRDKIDLKIDTQLISSRHLYRLEYSLHEKSGLVSMPIQKNAILSFEREQATPAKVVDFPMFWDRNAVAEAAQLFIRSQAFSVPEKEEKHNQEIVWDMDAAPEETFPPCMKLILAGIKDGRKRSVFILINFLQSIGWNKDMIEKRLEEWNAANPEPLREVNLKGSLRYHIGKKVLPPRCDNKAYYLDFGVCKPDQLCARIKNPVQYVRLKMRQSGAGQPVTLGKGKKKDDTQKDAAPVSTTESHA